MTARILAVLLAASLTALSFPTLADHAQWIHDNYPRCCSHEDCHPYAGRVSYDGEFYAFDWKGREVRWHELDALPSVDADYWVCEYEHDFTPRCFFRPMVGS